MLRNRWYPILPAHHLRRRPVGVKRLGQRLVVWRDAAGEPVVMPAFCPHRGADLSQGKVVAGQLACPWHGFRFAGDGRCTRMPCEGREARIPAAMSTRSLPARERYGLVWLWWGEAARATEEIPFFENLADPRGTADAARILPYHYSRMVETNLDIHHTPFVHGSVVPVGEEVADFEAHQEGDRILTSGVLKKPGKKTGMPFRDDFLLPCLNSIELTPRVRILVAATPVDDDHTWVWFRYHTEVTPFAWVRWVLSWLAIQSELRVVQQQDWRIFRAMQPGTLDDVPHHYVKADKGIALYRRLRRDLLEQQDASGARAAG
ncbi:MAG: aromatic ring-hydroxylating dioxygenase subunit alpha [Myxococcota bacterium]|nr:aromatic ring-hydroxylating dioxygenase subunit alpha [Myxococcota bacterium]